MGNLIIGTKIIPYPSEEAHLILEAPPKEESYKVQTLPIVAGTIDYSFNAQPEPDQWTTYQGPLIVEPTSETLQLYGRVPPETGTRDGQVVYLIQPTYGTVEAAPPGTQRVLEGTWNNGSTIISNEVEPAPTELFRWKRGNRPYSIYFHGSGGFDYRIGTDPASLTTDNGYPIHRSLPFEIQVPTAASEVPVVEEAIYGIFRSKPGYSITIQYFVQPR